MSAYTDGKAAVLYWSDEFNLTIVSQEENKIVLRGDLKKLTTENMQLQLAVETQGATLAHATGRIESLQADIDRLKAALKMSAASANLAITTIENSPAVRDTIWMDTQDLVGITLCEFLANQVDQIEDLFKEAGK